jgi:hypothetical protein
MKEITFEDIQRANEQIKTTDIKGKDYAEVNQRIKAFRMVYPTGRIHTQLISNENGVCIFRAEIYGNEIREIDGMLHQATALLATGTAYEKENSTFINKTSYIENCETSAVGRALGMAGFGIDTSIASAEEVQNAIQQQDDVKPVTKQNVNILQELIKTLPEARAFYDNLLMAYNITDLAQLTSKQYGEILIEIKKVKGE